MADVVADPADKLHWDERALAAADSLPQQRAEQFHSTNRRPAGIWGLDRHNGVHGTITTGGRHRGGDRAARTPGPVW